MQERATSTRRAILAAAAARFEKQGFAATSISDIVESASVTKGALYFHFPSKESLAEAVIAEQAKWREDQTWDERPGLQRLIDISFRFARALQRDPFVRASVRLTLDYATFATDDPSPYEQWIADVRGLLAEAAEAGELLPGVDLDQCARLVAGSVTGLQLLSEATTRRKDLLELIEALWQSLLPAIATSEAVESLDKAPRRAG